MILLYSFYFIHLCCFFIIKTQTASYITSPAGSKDSNDNLGETQIVERVQGFSLPILAFPYVEAQLQA